MDQRYAYAQFLKKHPPSSFVKSDGGRSSFIDKPARSAAWKAFVDALRASGHVTERQQEKWGYPWENVKKNSDSTKSR